MSLLRQVALVARRDFTERARSRAFLIMTLLTVGLVMAFAMLVSFELRDQPPPVVGITSPSGQLQGALVASAEDFDTTVEIKNIADVARGEEALRNSEVDVLLVGHELVWREDANVRLAAIVTQAVHGIDRSQIIAELGITEAEAAELVAQPPLATRVLEESQEEEEIRSIAANVGAIVLYTAILLFGQFVLMGVMEEKQSRVIEVVLSRVPPERLLTGKVIGVGTLGLLQLIILGGAMWAALNLVEVSDVDLASIGADVIIPLIFWFLLGYGFYAVIYAALGATVSRQEDAQGAVMLPLVMLIPAIVIGFVALENAESPLAIFGSLFPPTSPIVMPIRTAVADVPEWQVALAVVLLAASIYFIIKLAAKVYIGAILRIGAKVCLRDAWTASTQWERTDR